MNPIIFVTWLITIYDITHTTYSQCVAVCCSESQCVGVLQGVAACCIMTSLTLHTRSENSCSKRLQWQNRKMTHWSTWRDSFIYLWCDVTSSCFWRDMTPSYARCDMTPSYVWHDTTPSYVWRDMIYVTWLIHTRSRTSPGKGWPIVLKCVAACCSMLQHVAVKHDSHYLLAVGRAQGSACRDWLRHHAHFTGVDAICETVCILQRVAACCSVLQYDITRTTQAWNRIHSKLTRTSSTSNRMHSKFNGLNSR